jgi:membrane-bound serine protease (ClpP class)
LTLIALAILLLTIELKYYTHMVSGITGTILLALGAILLLQGPRRVAPALSVAVAGAFGIITIFLGFLGMRARKTKPVTGLETLVGKIGVARTNIGPTGTVFVQGEYWQARSDHEISAGKPVCIERVQDLLLYVKET